jgi:uncharacterized protein YlxP (DUF503 family)
VTVGSLEVDLRLEGCRSLKEKRRTLRPLIEKLRRDLNVSVAEVGDNDLWNVAVIGISTVGANRNGVEQTLDLAENVLHDAPNVRVENVVRETY